MIIKPDKGGKNRVKLELDRNQSAMVLTIDDEGEVSVDVATQEEDGLTAHVCRAIASKLIKDAEFQSEIMELVNPPE